jgi:hypothetical protein
LNNGIASALLSEPGGASQVKGHPSRTRLLGAHLARVSSGRRGSPARTGRAMGSKSCSPPHRLLTDNSIVFHLFYKDVGHGIIISRRIKLPNAAYHLHTEQVIIWVKWAPNLALFAAALCSLCAHYISAWPISQ